VPVIVQAGRIHLYEGLPPEEVVRPVEWLHGQGVKTLILTNAVGGLAGTLRRGDLVGAERVLAWPCTRARLSSSMACTVSVPGCDAAGTYCWVHGPCYETPAEIHALRRMGAMTVGMSCALELARATELGMGCGVVSCVTNVCGAPGLLTHEEVLEQARAASKRMCALLRGYLRAA
jgi:purine-nucleoside phosphorylase